MNNVYIPQQANIGNKSSKQESFAMKKAKLQKGYTSHKFMVSCMWIAIPVVVTAVITLALFGHKIL